LPECYGRSEWAAFSHTSILLDDNACTTDSPRGSLIDSPASIT